MQRMESSSDFARDWQSVRRILCVRLDSMGDVLMTSPAFRALRALPNQPELTLLTSPSGAEAGRLIAEIDQVWPAEVAWLKHTPQRDSSAVDRALIEQLRSGEFDGCVIFTVLTQNPLPSAMLCYLADIPLRLAHCRENPYQLLTHWVPDRETIHNARHEVRRQLELVRTVGAVPENERMSMNICAAARTRIAGWLNEHGIDATSKWCVLHPGATASSRRYPATRYAMVAQMLEQRGFRVVITGSASEEHLIEQVTHACKHSVRAAGLFDLEHLGALIAEAQVLITNNTGPAHIAASVGTPVVDLYALTNPQHTPWQVESRVLNVDVPCRNCLRSICPEGHHACLSQVTPESVVDGAMNLWDLSHPVRRAGVA